MMEAVMCGRTAVSSRHGQATSIDVCPTFAMSPRPLTGYENCGYCLTRSFGTTPHSRRVGLLKNRHGCGVGGCGCQALRPLPDPCYTLQVLLPPSLFINAIIEFSSSPELQERLKFPDLLPPDIAKKLSDPSSQWTCIDGLVRDDGECLVLPEDVSLQFDIICSAHSPPHAGHPGIEKTCEILSCNYYWNALRRNVTEFVKTVPPVNKRNYTIPNPQDFSNQFPLLPIPGKKSLRTSLSNSLSPTSSMPSWLLSTALPNTLTSYRPTRPYWQKDVQSSFETMSGKITVCQRRLSLTEELNLLHTSHKPSMNF